MPSTRPLGENQVRIQITEEAPVAAKLQENMVIKHWVLTNSGGGEAGNRMMRHQGEPIKITPNQTSNLPVGASLTLEHLPRQGEELLFQIVAD